MAVRKQVFWASVAGCVCSLALSAHTWWISNQHSQFAESFLGCFQIPCGCGEIIKEHGSFSPCWGWFTCLFAWVIGEPGTKEAELIHFNMFLHQIYFFFCFCSQKRPRNASQNFCLLRLQSRTERIRKMSDKCFIPPETCSVFSLNTIYLLSPVFHPCFLNGIHSFAFQWKTAIFSRFADAKK